MGPIEKRGRINNTSDHPRSTWCLGAGYGVGVRRRRAGTVKHSAGPRAGASKAIVTCGDRLQRFPRDYRGKPSAQTTFFDPNIDEGEIVFQKRVLRVGK